MLAANQTLPEAVIEGCIVAVIPQAGVAELAWVTQMCADACLATASS